MCSQRLRNLGTSPPGILSATGTRGVIDFTYKSVTIRPANGAEETLTWSVKPVVQLLERFARLVRGIDDPTRGVGTFEMARAHAIVVNAASEATAVVDVPQSMSQDRESPPHLVRAIDGVEEAFVACADSMQMLHESGRLAFTRPAGAMDVVGYSHFKGPRQAGRR